MRPLLLTILSLTLTACFPYHCLRRSGISGTVIDARSHRPVSNVAVSIMSLHPHLERANATTHSDTAGSFKIPPYKEPAMYILMEDLAVTDDAASFRIPGYNSLSLRVNSVIPGDGLENLGTVLLQPK